jgi:hypothetical protein
MELMVKTAAPVALVQRGPMVLVKVGTAHATAEVETGVKVVPVNLVKMALVVLQVALAQP